MKPETLFAYLGRNGYVRTGAVSEAGEYAMRGGIVDLFPPGQAQPLRIDFFGDDVESLRSFDPLSQRSTDKLDFIRLAAGAGIPPGRTIDRAVPLALPRTLRRRLRRRPAV